MSRAVGVHADVCPVGALLAWLQVRRPTGGRIFDMPADSARKVLQVLAGHLHQDLVLRVWAALLA